MASHQLFARREIKAVPIVGPHAPLAHRIEAHDFPIGHFRIKPVMFVFGLLLPQLRQALFEGIALRRKLLVIDQEISLIFFRGDVLGQFRDAEEAIDSLQGSNRKTVLQIPVQLPYLTEFGRKQKEDYVRLAADIGIGVDPRVGRRGILCTKRLQMGKNLLRLACGQLTPADSVNVEEEVHGMDALGQLYDWNDHGMKNVVRANLAELATSLDLQNLVQEVWELLEQTALHSDEVCTGLMGGGL